MENETKLCVDIAKEAEKVCKQCQEASENGDLAKSQELAHKLKMLEERVKQHQSNIDIEAQKLKEKHRK